MGNLNLTARRGAYTLKLQTEGLLWVIPSKKGMVAHFSYLNSHVDFLVAENAHQIQERLGNQGCITIKSAGAVITKWGAHSIGEGKRPNRRKLTPAELEKLESFKASGRHWSYDPTVPKAA